MKIWNVIFAVLSTSSLMAQNVEYNWAKNIGGTSNDVGNSISSDAAGNVYTTGYFSGTVDFDPGAGTSNLTSNGSDDIFISKLDASGNFVWAKSIGGLNADQGFSIDIDAAGNIHTTGFFSGTVDFDPGTGTSNMVSNGLRDIFISKLDASGNFVWAKNFGGSSSDQGNSIFVDLVGNVYSTGFFVNTVDFDPGTGTNNLTSVGYKDVFISKLDASGNFVWAKMFGGADNVIGNDIHVDGLGNVYTVGDFIDTVDFDPGVGSVNLVSNGIQDIFITKLNTSGDLVWAKSFGGSASDNGTGINVDNWGNVFTTGIFQNNADFDPGSGSSILSSNGATDAYISKLDASGDLVWAKSYGGAYYDFAYSICVDSEGDVYTIGAFQGTLDFDPGTGVNAITSYGSRDAYLTKLDTFGNSIWAKRVGGAGLETGYSIHVDGSGSVYATGLFQATADFDPGAGTSNLTPTGSADVFILKLSCLPSTATETVTSCNSFTWIDGNTYTSSTNAPQFSLINSAGCDSIITLNLTITSMDVNTTISGNIITVNETGATYQWIDCDNGNMPISGQTAQSFTVTSNGNYAVVVTVGNCSDTSACVSLAGVGIEELTKNKFSLFPNPATSYISISNFSAEINKISILDVSGKLITSFVPKSEVIDISKLQNGIYFVKIQAGNEIFTQQLVKQ